MTKRRHNWAWWRAAAPAVVVFVALTLCAEATVRVFNVPGWLVPAPSAVFGAMREHRVALGVASMYTLAAAVIGLAAAVSVGVLIAIGLSASRLVQRAFYPYAVFFQTVPIVAVAPLLVIWLGYGVKTVAASAFIVSVFPVIANTLTGLRSTDAALVDLFRLHGAGPVVTLWKLRLPAALPSVFTGMRVAAGLAVIGAIVAELFAASDGLGVKIKTHMTGRQTEVVFAAIVLATLLGLLLFGVVNVMGHAAMRRWHESERN